MTLVVWVVHYFKLIHNYIFLNHLEIYIYIIKTIDQVTFFIMKVFKYENDGEDDGDSEKFINKILKTLENDKYDDLMELSYAKIKTIKNDILQSLQLKGAELKDFHKKLKSYRYVDEINEFKIGNYIRTIDLREPDNIKLSKGGIIVDIEAVNSNLLIKTKNFQNRIFTLRFEEHLFFQKFNQQEEILLSVMNHIQTN